MTVADLSARLGYRMLSPGKPGAILRSGYTGDLLSDVMAHAEPDSVLVTVQAHRNAVAVASIAGVRAIVLCNGREAPPDMLAAAEQEAIALYATQEGAFLVSHRIAAELERT